MDVSSLQGHHSAKQYLKMKPIKWGFKWWCRCASDTGYLYQIELYLGKKDSEEHNLGEGVVLHLSESLEGTYCALYFDNFFTSPKLVDTLFKNGIYGVGTVRQNRKQMPDLPNDKDMSRGDTHFQYADRVVACKWYDNRGVVLLAANTDGVDEMTSVGRRKKGAATKTIVPCPQMIKRYNAGMGGVDLLDQRTAAYRLDRKSTHRFYLRIFFDLMDIACVNAYIVYATLNPESAMTLLDFKISLSRSLIGPYCSRKRNVPSTRVNRRNSIISVMPAEVPQHMPIVEAVRQRCHYCAKEGSQKKSKIRCSVCGIYLCLNETRNCFLKHHYGA
jgi:hypothetical protein